MNLMLPLDGANTVESSSYVLYEHDVQCVLPFCPSFAENLETSSAARDNQKYGKPGCGRPSIGMGVAETKSPRGGFRKLINTRYYINT